MRKNEVAGRDKGRDTRSVVRVVETQAAYDLEFLARERSEELFHGQDSVGHLCSGIKGGPDDFICFDGLLVPGSKTD